MTGELHSRCPPSSSTRPLPRGGPWRELLRDRCRRPANDFYRRRTRGDRTDARRERLRLYLAPGDGEALTERILALAGDRQLCASLGARAREAFERQWDKEKALSEWEALLQAVIRHLG